MATENPVVYFNGSLKLESEVGISIRDRGYLYGDAVFDATRTFSGAPFKLREHIHRLYDSLRYLRIDPGLDPEAMEHWSLEVVAHNYPLLPPNQDMWVMQRISRGVESAQPGEANHATVLIESHAIPFASRAPLYRDGAKVRTPSVPRTPPRFMSPRAKTHNYLNLVLGDLEAQGVEPGSWGGVVGRKRQSHRRPGVQHIPGQGRAVEAPRGASSSWRELPGTRFWGWLRGWTFRLPSKTSTCSTPTRPTRRF